MTYNETKTKGIIRESYAVLIERINQEALKKTGNPYAAVEAQGQLFTSTILNKLTEETYTMLKERRLIHDNCA